MLLFTWVAVGKKLDTFFDSVEWTGSPRTDECRQCFGNQEERRLFLLHKKRLAVIGIPLPKTMPALSSASKPLDS